MPRGVAVLEMHAERPRSNWWFLLPILLGVIGWIIAYFVLRHDDPRKARNCIYLGVVLTIVGFGLNFLLAAQISQVEQSLGFDVGV